MFFSSAALGAASRMSWRRLLLVLLTLSLAAPLPAVAQSTMPRTTAQSAKPKPKAKPKISPELEQQILEVIRRNPEVVYEVLKKYAVEQQALQEKREQAAQSNAVKKLLQDTKTVIGDSPTTGAPMRKILLVEFSDFQCPYCATATVNVRKFMAKHKDKVTLVYKHFPLTQSHPQALPAAKAAWAAHKQGKFWEYHDGLFANQSKLGEEFYLQLAQQLKLDIKRFKADYAAADNSILADYSLGRKLGVNGTPSFVLNGEFFTGIATVEDMEKILARVPKR
jgi:protein-disulfide isomerase